MILNFFASNKLPEGNLVLLEPPGLPGPPGRHVVLSPLVPVLVVLLHVRDVDLRPLPDHPH